MFSALIMEMQYYKSLLRILQNCYIFYSIEKLALEIGFLPVYFTHVCLKVSFKHSILDQMVMMESQQFFCHPQVWAPALNQYSRHSPPHILKLQFSQK